MLALTLPWEQSACSSTNAGAGWCVNVPMRTYWSQRPGYQFGSADCGRCCRRRQMSSAPCSSTQGRQPQVHQLRASAEPVATGFDRSGWGWAREEPGEYSDASIAESSAGRGCADARPLRPGEPDHSHRLPPRHESQGADLRADRRLSRPSSRHMPPLTQSLPAPNIDRVGMKGRRGRCLPPVIAVLLFPSGVAIPR